MSSTSSISSAQSTSLADFFAAIEKKKKAGGTSGASPLSASSGLTGSDTSSTKSATKTKSFFSDDLQGSTTQGAGAMLGSNLDVMA